MGGKPVDNEGLATMGFVSHLAELRRRLAYIVATVLAAMLIAFGYAEFETSRLLDSIHQKMIALGLLRYYYI